MEALGSGAEDDAGCGAVGVELAFRVDSFSFSRSSAPAHVNDVRFATDHPRLCGHWPDITVFLLVALTVDGLARGNGNVLYRWRFLFWLWEQFHESVNLLRHVSGNW